MLERARAATLTLLLLAAPSGLARADGKDLSLVAIGCDDGGEIARIAALELGMQVDRAASPAAASVVVRCGTDDAWIEAPARPRARAELTGVAPRLRSRVIALAVADVLEEKPMAPVAPPVVVARAPTPPPRREPRVFTATAEVVGRSFLDTADRTWGVAVRLDSDLAGHARVGAGALAETGSAVRTAGDVRVRAVAAVMAVALRAGTNRWDVSAGPVLTAGIVQARGEPSASSMYEPRSLTGPWVTAALRAALAYAIAPHVAVYVPVELGTTAVTIRARTDGSDERLWRGPWLLLALGVRWRP